MDEDTIICRCEDITLAGLKALLAEGAGTLDELKRLGRLGMGPCQGRTCLSLAARWLAGDLAEITWPAARPPVAPVPLGVLAGGDEPLD